MLFHNASKLEQKFSVGNRAYAVAPGANVEIPDNLAYVVKARGMVLVEGPSPVEGAPVVSGVEALHPRAEVLLASPRLNDRLRASFRAEYARANNARRAQLVEQLEGIAEGKGAASVEEADEPAEEADETSAQLDDAVQRVGRGRRPRGG